MSVLKNILEIWKLKKVPVARSGEWSKVRDKHIKEHPVCAVCGETSKLEVHHIMPFHDAPELELDPNNLITLCEIASHGIICHLCIGHCGNYRNYNSEVVEDAKLIKQMFENKKE